MYHLLSLYSAAMQNYWYWGFALGQPPNAKICVGDINMLVSKNVNICVTPNANFKICITPKPLTPTRVSGINFRVDHVQFMLFVLIPFALGTQSEPSLQWNMGFRVFTQRESQIYHLRFSIRPTNIHPYLET